MSQILKQKIEKLVSQFKVGNYSLVIREGKLLLKKLPENPFLYNLIGLSHQNLNDLESAEKFFVHVIKIDNKHTAALNNLGNVYKDLKNFKLAEKNYLDALHLNPKFINALVNYGSLNNSDFGLDKYNQPQQARVGGGKVDYNSLSDYGLNKYTEM